jgi:hypothetical protein
MARQVGAIEIAGTQGHGRLGRSHHARHAAFAAVACIPSVSSRRGLNPEHEVVGARVIVGCAISLAGASTVAIDTEIILHALAIPHEVARALAWRISPGTI